MTQQKTTPAASKISPTMLVFIAIPILGLIAAVAVLLNNSQVFPTGEPTPVAVTLASNAAVINAPMLDFTLDTLDGRTLSLSDFAGRVVFLNFWATWCGPCERETPTLNAFAQEQIRQPDGAVVLAVNMRENPTDVRNFLNARSVNSLYVLMDTEGDVSDQYGVFNLPVTFVIDREGIVRYPKYGEITLPELNAYVEAVDALDQGT